MSPAFYFVDADIGLLNENPCSRVNIQLQVLIEAIPGYLKEHKKYVLSVLNSTLWEKGYTWVTADVALLYTIIPHNFAILALTCFLDTSIMMLN